MKSKNKTQKITILPVNIIHGIKEDDDAVSRVHNNAVHGYMPIYVHEMVFLNLPQPSCQSMIALPHEKHLANKLSKVGIILEHEIKLNIGLLP